MKIKINGSFVEVKENDDIEVGKKPEGAEPAAETDEEKDLMSRAKALGKTIAEEAIAKLGGGETSAVTKRLEKLMATHFPQDSKLKQIINGKDLYAGDELTKEEKIIAFFYGLVSRNDNILRAVAEKAQGETNGADGGYLFPKEFMGEILRDLPDLNVMRQYVRIVPMKRNKMDITNLVNPLQVFWTAENAVKSTTTARFAQQTLTAFKAAAIIYSSDELIEDSTEFDVVALIIQLFSEAIATEEEKVIWTGNGTTQPQGINVATVASIAGTGNAYNDITNLFYTLPSKYRVNAAWFLNSSTAATLEVVKDTTGRPLFNQASEGIPATLKGKPVVISEWAPSRVLYFGDMKRAYFLGDRKRMTAKVSNDTETAFTKDQTAIRVVFRIGGLLAWPAAVRKCTNF